MIREWLDLQRFDEKTSKIYIKAYTPDLLNFLVNNIFIRREMFWQTKTGSAIDSEMRPSVLECCHSIKL